MAQRVRGCLTIYLTIPPAQSKDGQGSGLGAGSVVVKAEKKEKKDKGEKEEKKDKGEKGEASKTKAVEKEKGSHQVDLVKEEEGKQQSEIASVSATAAATTAVSVADKGGERKDKKKDGVSSTKKGGGGEKSSSSSSSSRGLSSVSNPLLGTLTLPPTLAQKFNLITSNYLKLTFLLDKPFTYHCF